jgi:hypothetical protein
MVQVRRWVHGFAAFCGGCNELHSFWNITNQRVVVQLSILLKLLEKEGSLPMSFMNCQMVTQRGSVRSTSIAQMISIGTSWSACEV